MRLWVLDTNLVVDLLEGEPTRKAPLMRLAEHATKEGAFLAVSSVTVHEYLVIPRAHGEDAYHRCRLALNRFQILQFDWTAAEEAAKRSWPNIDRRISTPAPLPVAKQNAGGFATRPWLEPRWQPARSTCSLAKGRC